MRPHLKKALSSRNESSGGRRVFYRFSFAGGGGGDLLSVEARTVREAKDQLISDLLGIEAFGWVAMIDGGEELSVSRVVVAGGGRGEVLERKKTYEGRRKKRGRSR